MQFANTIYIYIIYDTSPSSNHPPLSGCLSSITCQLPSPSPQPWNLILDIYVIMFVWEGGEGVKVKQLFCPLQSRGVEGGLVMIFHDSYLIQDISNPPITSWLFVQNVVSKMIIRVL